MCTNTQYRDARKHVGKTSITGLVARHDTGLQSPPTNALRPLENLKLVGASLVQRRRLRTSAHTRSHVLHVINLKLAAVHAYFQTRNRSRSTSRKKSRRVSLGC